MLALCLSWNAGEKTEALAAQLRTNRNTVLGKVHRLKAFGILEGRPSPIGRTKQRPVDAPREHRKIIRAPLVTLPRPPALVLPPVPAPPAPRPLARIVDCCWPIGTPGNPSFRYCGAAADHGRPYCADHARVAFVRMAS
jgi:GcrA cell cycle regulator